MFVGPSEVSTLGFRCDHTTGYQIAAKGQFPNVGEKFVVGCLPELWPSRLPRVTSCEKCRTAEAEWVRSKATQSNPKSRKD